MNQDSVQKQSATEVLQSISTEPAAGFLPKLTPDRVIKRYYIYVYSLIWLYKITCLLNRRLGFTEMSSKTKQSRIKNKVKCLILICCFIVSCRQTESIQNTVDSNRDVIQSGIPEIPDSLINQIRKYQNSRSAQFQGFMPNGKGIVILTRFAETNQIHIVKSQGGAREQVTFGSESVISTSICPDPKRNLILFIQDRGGNEKFQIFSMKLSNMSIQMLTDGESQNDGVLWSNRGDKFVYQSTRRNGKDWDIYLSDADKPTDAKMILSKDGLWSVMDWAPDDKKMLISNYVSRTISFLYTFDLNTGRLESVFNTNDTASIEDGNFDLSGNGLFYTSDKNTDFRCIRYHNLITGNDTVLTSEIKWDIRYFIFSRDRKKLVFFTNEHGFFQAYLMDPQTFSYRKIQGVPSGALGISFIDSSGNLLGISISKPDRPEDVYVIDLNTSKVEQWTYSEAGGLDSNRMIVPEVIEYQTFDSVNGKPRMIPCFKYTPKGKGPFPVLIFIHGGPESQYWPYFSQMFQFYTRELGISVLAPNVRGSGGYGKTYLKLDDGFKREDPVKDIGCLLEWIKKQSDFDSSRIAVIGGSYGGFMVLASMVHFSSQLKAGIDLYGISNFITFLENTAPYRQDLRRVEYGDERDPEMRKFLIKISPVTNASKINKPLLIIQGANDPRVPVEESRQIADKVRKNNENVWFLLFNDEEHGFRNKKNRDYQESVVVMFLKKYLIDSEKIK